MTSKKVKFVCPSPSIQLEQQQFDYGCWCNTQCYFLLWLFFALLRLSALHFNGSDQWPKFAITITAATTTTTTIN